MGLSTAERRRRLRDLLETVFSSKHPIGMPSLVRSACAEWTFTARTGREYVQSLIDAGWVRFKVPGGPLIVTAAGERELRKADAEAKESEHQVKITPAKEPGEV